MKIGIKSTLFCFFIFSLITANQIEKEILLLKENKTEKGTEIDDIIDEYQELEGFIGRRLQTSSNNSTNKNNDDEKPVNSQTNIDLSGTNQTKKYVPVNKEYNVLLTDYEISEYLNTIDLKLAFEKDFDYLPKYFTFDDQYVASYKKFTLFFGVIVLCFAGAIGAYFLIKYLITRFVKGKSRKTNEKVEVNKNYRNVSWILFGTGSLGFLITYIIILKSTFSINKGADESFIYAQEKSNSLVEEHVKKIFAFKNASQSLYTFSNESEKAFSFLEAGISDYKKDTDSTVNKFLEIEEKKNLVSVILFVFYTIVILLVIILLFKKVKNPVVFLSNIVFLTIPLLIILAGIICISFMIYSDFCTSIHSAIYEDHFPIYNKGIGKLISCFNSTTKSSIFQVNNEVTNVLNIVNPKIQKLNITASDLSSLHKIMNEVNGEFNITSAMSDLISCKHVYQILPVIQAKTCTKGKDWVTLIQFYLLLVVFIIILGISFNRFSHYIQKKLDEDKDTSGNTLIVQ